MAATQQAAGDFSGRDVLRVRIKRVAAEQIHLFDLRKQTGTRIAARRAFHLFDGQVFAYIGSIGVELVAAVEVAGNDQHVAANTRATRRGEPVGASALDQLDELEV